MASACNLDTPDRGPTSRQAAPSLNYPRINDLGVRSTDVAASAHP